MDISSSYPYAIAKETEATIVYPI